MIVNNDIKELGMTHDDAIQGANSGGSGGGGGLSIGSGTPVQNLDNKNELEPPEDYTPYIPEQPIFPEPTTDTTPEETKATQGEQAQAISNANREIERINEQLDQLKNVSGSKLYSLFKELNQTEKQKIYDILSSTKSWNYNKDTLGEKTAWNNLSPEQIKLVTKELKDYYTKELAIHRDTIYNIQTSDDYDPRTVEEQRQDTATQRAAKDYIAAGLNPKALSGFTGGGGGGGGGNSKDDEEEKKRKRRRQELEEIRRARKAEKMREIELVTGIVQSLTNTATKAVGGAAFMNHQKTLQQNANNHNRYMIEAEKMAGNKKYRLDDEVGYYDEKGKWHNIKLKDIRE